MSKLTDDLTYGQYKDIMDHIIKVKQQAEKEEIKANMIIIDEGIAKTNHLLISGYFKNGYRMVPPMIFGLEVKYAKNLIEDYGAFFIITEGPTANDRISKLEEENRELREKLERVKDILGYE